MSSILIIISFLVLCLIEVLYFRVAEKFNIIDQPNHRSSHSSVVLRGGGIIFSIGLLIYPFYFGFLHKYFLLGLALISFISFIDDIKPVSNKIRISFHLVSVALMFYQLELFNLSTYWIILALVFVIGSINAINFMDGINGITGAYALIALCSLLFINTQTVEFINSSFLITSILTVLVFNIFNFRKLAKCFAGDVGSVSIAFVIMYLLLLLIIKTQNISYLLLLLVYGLDTVTTIFFRIVRRENIFDAHRSHFYQYWANEKKVPHLFISSAYALVQLIINIFVIVFATNSISILIITLLFCTIIFLIIRFSTEGSKKLFGTKNA